MSAECTEILTHKQIKVEEGKRKAVFLNPASRTYYRVRIDGCLIKDGLRCDYLVSEEDTMSVLVELKGSGVEHACDQLFTAAEHPKVKKTINKKLGFLVICSKYPRVDTYVLRAKQTAARKYKAGFHVCCDRGVFEILKVVRVAQ